MKRVLLLLTLALAGCATSSHVLTGAARPAITPEQVKIYSEPPPGRYDKIAIIDATSAHSFSVTSQQKSDKVVARLKEEAARLGANGIILQGIGEQASGATISGGGFSFGGNVGIGTGVSVPITRKAGNAVAIYVYP